MRWTVVRRPKSSKALPRIYPALIANKYIWVSTDFSKHGRSPWENNNLRQVANAEGVRGLDSKDVYAATSGRIKEQDGEKPGLGVTALM